VLLAAALLTTLLAVALLALPGRHAALASGAPLAMPLASDPGSSGGPGAAGAVDTTAGAPGGAAAVPTVTVFYGEGCPYCARERAFLEELQGTYPDLEVVALEVWNDAGNLALLRQTAAALGFEVTGVPVTVLDGRWWVGFDSTVQAQLTEAVAAVSAGQAPPVEEARTSVDVPFLGTVDLGGRSLLLSTLVIGFVDGVNPCSLWVLTMLLAIVLHTGSRPRVLLVGTVFLLVTAALYGVYVLGLFSALSVIGALPWIRALTAAVAGVFGILHLREHVTTVSGAHLPGPSVAIDASRKPGIYRRMRTLAVEDASLPLLLGGTMALAVGVSLAETPCTAGLPMLWADLVHDAGVGWAGRVALFSLYLLVFLLDELLVFGAAVLTMRAAKLQERHGAALQLLSGVLMLVLAGVLLVAPEVLDTVLGATAVFAAAGLVVALVLVVEHTVLGLGGPTAPRPALAGPARSSGSHTTRSSASGTSRRSAGKPATPGKRSGSGARSGARGHLKR
jgi:thiol-disulfide isomerase/thioredoxin